MESPLQTAAPAPIANQMHPAKTILSGWLGIGSLGALLESAYLMGNNDNMWLDDLESLRFIMSHLARFGIHSSEVKAVIDHRVFSANSILDLIFFLGTSIPLTLLVMVPVVLIAVVLATVDLRKTPEATFWGAPLKSLSLTLPLTLPLNGLLRRGVHVEFADMELAITLLFLVVLAWLIQKIGKTKALDGILRVSLAFGIACLIVPQVINRTTDTRDLSTTNKQKSPNILLVSIDSLRSDHLHTYGYERETSPNIDQLAAEGVRFDTVVSSTSWTLPSHHTMMTGLTPEQHGVTSQKKSLSPRIMTLAEALKANGYSTAGIVAGFFLSSSYGFNQGFDHYDDKSVLKRHGAGAFKTVTSPQLIDLSIEWLANWNKWNLNRPFFMFLHLWDVHYDYIPPAPYDTLFDPDYSGSVDGTNFEKNPAIVPEMSKEDLEHVIALYDGEIKFTDFHLGRLIQWLKKANLFDETLIVVVADHGEEFFEHGKKGHMKTLYDESILVPWVMRLPSKIEAGTVITQQTRLLDLAPTLLSLSNTVVPDTFAHFNGEKMAWDLSGLFDENKTMPPENLPGISSLYTHSSALRTLSHKYYIHKKGVDLFDLKEDPAEQKNLADAENQKERAKAMQVEISDWMSETPPPGQRSERAKVSKALNQQLRALGYVD